MKPKHSTRRRLHTTLLIVAAVLVVALLAVLSSDGSRADEGAAVALAVGVPSPMPERAPRPAVTLERRIAGATNGETATRERIPAIVEPAPETAPDPRARARRLARLRQGLQVSPAATAEEQRLMERLQSAGVGDRGSRVPASEFLSHRP